MSEYDGAEQHDHAKFEIAYGSDRTDFLQIKCCHEV